MYVEIEYIKKDNSGIAVEKLPVTGPVDAAYIVFMWLSTTGLNVLQCTYISKGGERHEAVLKTS